MADATTIVDGIDRRWLAEAVARDPVAHAFAAWDIEYEPDRIRLASCRRSGTTVAYLLVWLGDPARPYVHWVGSVEESRQLAERLPPRPLTIVGAPNVVETVAAARGPVSVTPLLRLTARPSGPVWMSDDPRVRRVDAPDADRLRAWAQNHPDPMARGYARFDPARHVVWAAFQGDRVVGAAVATVRLPSMWTFNAIYVEPFARGAKLGTALTAHALEAARRAGAPAQLNVHEDNGPARRVYDRLGFRYHDRLVAMEAKG